MNLGKCIAQSSLHTVPSDLELMSDTGRIPWGERATLTLRLGPEFGDNSPGCPIWQYTIPAGLVTRITCQIDTLLPQ